MACTANMADTNDAAQPKKSRMSLTWSKSMETLALDVDTFLKMVKFALPPTIALSMYQASAVSSVYSSVGYLIAVGSVLSGVLQPRAIFLQTMMINTFAISLTTAIATLANWSSMQARKHTTAPGAPLGEYNSSASAVSAVWLFFMIYAINSLKFSIPGLRFACVLSSIITIVTQTYGAQNPTLAADLGLIRELYGAIMTGIAISTGVNVLFFPLSCRKLVFEDIEKYIEGMRQVLNNQLDYMHSVETHNMFRDNSEAAKLRAAVQGLRGVHGKLHADITWAKKEFAFGKLNGKDLTTIHRLLRKAFLPLTGFITMADVFDRLAKLYNWDVKEGVSQTTPTGSIDEGRTVDEYQDIMKNLHAPFRDLGGTLSDALDHLLIRLELGKLRSKLSRRIDLEKASNPTEPGGIQFAERLRRDLDTFYQRRAGSLRVWCAEQGIQLAPNSFHSKFSWHDGGDEATLFKTHRQRQLFVLLDIQLLMYSAGLAILHLVEWADVQIASGEWARSRLLIPAPKQIVRFFKPFSDLPRHSDGEQMTMNEENEASSGLYFGEAYSSCKDPDHLPPENGLQHIGVVLRQIGSILRSPHSVFGFRMACACMCIGVVAFLRDSQDFFVEYRLFWAEIFVVVTMVRTSGEGGFIYFLRILGSITGAVLAYPIYYIADGKTPGVLVLFFVALTCIGWIPIKLPRFALLAILTTITNVIVIGYTLQVRKIGEQAATANRQKYYPIYLLAPYRLIVTMGGVFVAFIFTFFPFPTSERSELRQSLGQALYLAACHYAVVQETVRARVGGDEGNVLAKSSPGYRLEKERVKVLSKMMLLIQKMKQQSSFTRWQIPIDCKFPKRTYDALIDCVDRITSHTALIGCSSTVFGFEGDKANGEWRNAFQHILMTVESEHDQITSFLCLLSSSLLNAQPLPPHLKLPQPYGILKVMQTIDSEILGISRIMEPAYAGFAMLQISNRAIVADLKTLTDLIKELVGELDFSYRYVSEKSKAS